MNENGRAAELGKILGRAVKAAAPRVQRLATEAKPRLEEARDGALKFAREHDDEIKQLAGRLVRARLGPLGVVVDAFAPTGSAPKEATCRACAAANPGSARFCNQCGAALVG
jgi:hypothetical protein